MTLTDADLPELLRSRSLRVTNQRLAVLEQVHTAPHSDVDTITRGVRTRLGKVSRQAVYDVLRALTAAELVRQIEPAGSPTRYEARVGDNHHHLVCRACGDIVDVDCAPGLAPCLTPSTDHGYTVDEAEVVFWGYCPRCQVDAWPRDRRLPSLRHRQRS